MVKLEQRIMSSVNLFVEAKHPVSCSSCDSEVTPAMTIERGYTVEAVSLVEAKAEKPTALIEILEIDDGIGVADDINSPQSINMLGKTEGNSEGSNAIKEGFAIGMNVAAISEKPTATIEILEIEGNIEVSDDVDAPVTMNSLSKPEENAGGASATRETTAAKMNIAAQEAEVTSEVFETETENSWSDCKETENAAESVENANAEFESFSSEKSVKIVEVNQEDYVGETSGEEFEASDEDEVPNICFVPRSVCKKIGLAIDKARLCLTKIGCLASKNFKDLSREQNNHVKEIKELTTKSLASDEAHVVEELSFVSEELMKNVEYLSRQMLDCQQKSLVDVITTLKQDIETELTSMKKIEDQVHEQPISEKENSKSFGSVTTFLKDASWTSFGFLSLLVANLGYFSLPLFQSFQTCFVHCLDDLKNSTIFQ